MKLTRNLAPGSLELLNLRFTIRAARCRHCQRSEFRLTWLLPGACRIRARNRYPGTTFFCSNRYPNLGCGRIFPVLWDEILPHASLRMTKGLFPDYANTTNRYVRQRNDLLRIQ